MDAGAIEAGAIAFRRRALAGEWQTKRETIGNRANRLRFRATNLENTTGTAKDKEAEEECSTKSSATTTSSSATTKPARVIIRYDGKQRRMNHRRYEHWTNCCRWTPCAPTSGRLFNVCARTFRTAGGSHGLGADSAGGLRQFTR